ncbi:MAG TPA: alpha/beta fold hydrolase [Candidatus Binatia bacterium]|nr:alpha/beta fold hydrolase [Candidatus Binatia bacterium]
MPDVTAGTMPITGQAPGGRPIRKDEIEVVDRGVYVESWLPERRSRRRPLVFVHGELAGSWVWERYLGYFASRGWEGHALNLANHYWSHTADPTTLTIESYTADVVSVLDRVGEGPVLVGHGLGGLLALLAAEQRPLGGLVLISPELPDELRMPARQYELREVGEVYGKDRIGWETLSERIQRDNNDLTLDDVRRIQHMLGQKPHESGTARRQVLLGIPVRREALAGIPTLVIGAGLDKLVPEPGSERLADWLGAGYEPFGAHSHFGLVAGEHSYVQVADGIRAFLETNRL